MVFENCDLFGDNFFYKHKQKEEDIKETIFECTSDNWKDWKCPQCSTFVKNMNCSLINRQITCVYCDITFHYCQLIRGYSKNDPIHVIREDIKFDECRSSY